MHLPYSTPCCLLIVGRAILPAAAFQAAFSSLPEITATAGASGNAGRDEQTYPEKYPNDSVLSPT
jgi:hypothetical protein